MFTAIVYVIIAGLVISGVIRWITQFIELIKAGGLSWLKSAGLLLASVIAGIVGAYAFPPAGSVAFGLAFLWLFYAAAILATVQYGYEVIVKPVIALVEVIYTWAASKISTLTLKK